ncbi:MAG TPA: hypothetical protein VGO59_11965 [Verrucomicrobiae bacterium]
MKKFMGFIVISALFSWASSASAFLVQNVTNSVQQVNFELAFVSQLGMKTTYTTNITHAVKKITTNVTYTVSRKSFGTKDVIASLLGSNAPAGAVLVRVKNNLYGESFEIRFGTTRVLTGNVRINEPGSVMVLGTKYQNGNLLAGSGADLSFRQFAVTGAHLSFAVYGATEFTYVTASLGKYSEVVGNLSATVAGTGADSIGNDELVTGTIAITGPVLKVEHPLNPA